MAAHSLAGVKGMSMGGAPTWRNASVTALAKAGNEPQIKAQVLLSHI